MCSFNSEYDQLYKEQCECGAVIEVVTQKDNNPEYYTTVLVKCTCGRYVDFSLPVN